MHGIEGETANQVWLEAALLLQNQAIAPSQASRGGATRELLHVHLSIRKPRERWILARSPAINPAFAIAEVIWILNGRRDSAFLNYWNPILPKFAGSGPSYYGAYGFRLRHHFNLDQIQRAYKALKNNPDSRQVVLQIWDPSADLPTPNGKPKADDIPCNICSLLKLRGGSLEWLQIMRSNDIILGLPHNVVQFTYLHELMAAWLEVDLGSYHHLSDSLHVYSDQLSMLAQIDTATDPARNTDRWTLGYRESQEVLEQISERMDILRQQELTPDQLRSTASLRTGGEAPQNMLRVVAADAARRHNFDQLAEEIIANCTCKLLTQSWRRWVKRTQS